MDTRDGGRSTGSNDAMHCGTSPEKRTAFAEAAAGPQSRSKAMAHPDGEVKIERVEVAANRASALSFVHLLMDLFD
jgi:hypothetical protein